MGISSYPRTTVQGSGPSQNPQNGLGLMVLNPSTNKYEAVTSATFSGGGGGGATSANQTEQIDIATESNGFLDTISQYLTYDGNPIAELLFSTEASRSIAELLYSNGASKSTANLLNDINNTLLTIETLLTDIKSNQTNGSQRTVLQDSGGNLVNVTSNALNVDTGA